MNRLMDLLQTLKTGAVVTFLAPELATVAVSVSGVCTVALAGGVLTITAVAVGSCVIIASRTDGSFLWRPVTVTV